MDAESDSDVSVYQPAQDHDDEMDADADEDEEEVELAARPGANRPPRPQYGGKSLKTLSKHFPRSMGKLRKPKRVRPGSTSAPS
jgi:hypothetical protein